MSKKGIGNKFMDDLRQADVLIQIVDFSGLTDEEGKPLDLLLSPVGVPSRINPAQILESSLGELKKSHCK